MKLEKAMKRYYHIKLDEIRPSEFFQQDLEIQSLQLFKRILFSDAMLNIVIHSVITVFLVTGFFQYRQESRLSEVLCRYAADHELNRYFDSRLQSLPEEIIKIRKSF